MAGEPLLESFQRARLEANGREQAPVKGTACEIDFVPVVRLRDHEEGRIWLLTEIDPDQPSKAWGLCLSDPEYPEPYMGTADLNELVSVKQAGFLTVDADFTPEGPVSDYLLRARALDTLDI